jgi:hypothetical protein
MRHGFLACLALGFALAACSTTQQPADGAAPGAAARQTPTFTVVLVLRDIVRFQQGDTAIVDFANITEANEAPYYLAGRWIGKLPLDILGPSQTGTMVVTADRMNVRNCRSTGCTIVGTLTRGQHVQVNDFAGRWYRLLEDGDSVGYLNAEHLQMPLAYRRGHWATVRRKTADYYDSELRGLAVDGSSSTFSGYAVKLDGDELSIEFYTHFEGGPGLDAVCIATRGIVDFVQNTMANTPRGVFSSYSFGVYYNAPESPPTAEVMVAGPSGGGAVYCAR